MFDKSAIEALQFAASITNAHTALDAALLDRHAAPVVALPSDFKLHELEDHLPGRSRARGAMETTSLESFANYIRQHAGAGCTVFVDAVNMRARAVLNLGTSLAPGHADDVATLKPEKTAPYTALLQATTSGISQKAAAEFLEDWSGEVECFNDAGLIAPKLAIGAIRRISIEGARKVESEVQNLSATQSAFESVIATSKDPIPTLIYFTCQPYADLPGRAFVMRLGITTGDKDPRIVLRIIKDEEHREEMAAELCERITELIGDAAQTVIGTYTRKD